MRDRMRGQMEWPMLTIPTYISGQITGIYHSISHTSTAIMFSVKGYVICTLPIWLQSYLSWYQSYRDEDYIHGSALVTGMQNY